MGTYFQIKNIQKKNNMQESIQKVLKTHSDATYKFRQLTSSDLNRDFLSLLGQMTSAPFVDSEKMAEEWETYYLNNPMIHIIALVELETNLIIGTGRILIEPKLTRGLSKVAHIEDIVISNQHGGKGLGKKLIALLMDLSSEMGCYKAILECNDKVKGFYEKVGFNVTGYTMRKDLI